MAELTEKVDGGVYDTLVVTIKFDRALPRVQAAENAAEVFEAQLRNELLRGCIGGGPWGYGRAQVESVIVHTGDPVVVG